MHGLITIWVNGSCTDAINYYNTNTSLFSLLLILKNCLTV